MLLQYQRFQLGGRVEEIEVETNPVTGKQYILLRDVQDVFPTAARFEKDGRPVRFQSDEQGNRLEPWRIACHPEVTLQIIPVRQSLLQTAPTTGRRVPISNEHSQTPQSPGSPSILLPTQAGSSEEDWREYLFQRAVRMAILVVASMLTVLVNHGVSSLMWHSSPYSMATLYWRVVSMVLFVLSVVWFLMLVALIVQVVWFLVNAPIAARRSLYQRLFDF
ncbi:hypothetical protein BGZ80_003373 [Entomortierella chlamydospora]|uniref:Uncharacterized protein n=1 Tax=Entomortierella chlamydospora TaxID=101097 RepID=A0A9P6N0T7_9FUNG|nr:hypothetical protein BGZ79_007266 [Entomortierella chlamydospora]KAG0020902.1 hypothetical protein BGZ80_003373 [Entomortierella chlamydospora]